MGAAQTSACSVGQQALRDGNSRSISPACGQVVQPTPASNRAENILRFMRVEPVRCFDESDRLSGPASLHRLDSNASCCANHSFDTVSSSFRSDRAVRFSGLSAFRSDPRSVDALEDRSVSIGFSCFGGIGGVDGIGGMASSGRSDELGQMTGRRRQTGHRPGTSTSIRGVGR